MRKTMLMIVALGVSLAAGVERLYAAPQLIVDDEVPCAGGSGPECDRTTTEVCTRWKIVEIEIGPTGGATRVCDTKVTTTDIRYIMYP